ncbi:MAG: fumarate reductase/succinate dehydrogenase flavoprotein subunit [Gammaproteobacteria bacterium]|nr:fumarate reductase/succinate dehydrogenase flavoprotein subunit [Gammaproteobacteria bacterium]
MISDLNANEPTGPLENRWTRHRFDMALVNPANRKKYRVIVVGTGLAGGSAAATLGEMGYRVKSFCFQDSPRRAHSIAAQGGINAAKNYQNDGDSIWRLFYDTIKGGDFRSRESNVYRLAEISVNIIDQAVAQGVPFAREYSGLLANRSFGGAQVSRTFYARGQTGQQLLLGAYQALNRQVAAGTVTLHPRTEMLELIVIDGRARGIVTRNLVDGSIESHTADCVVLCTGGYGNAYYLSTNAKGCNTSAAWRAHRHGALFANPCFTQIHPTCIPQSGTYQSKLTLMSESLRNDGRVWAPLHTDDSEADPATLPHDRRDYFLERRYPAFGNLVPRDIASRAAKEVCDQGHGVGPEVNGRRLGVYLDFSEAIEQMGEARIRERYGNLFEMYERITGESPYTTPMRIYPAIHYAMGGLWVDYNLMTSIDGLFATGECNFSDHGANRLGASALMQGLADGYFVVPYSVGNYLARHEPNSVPGDHAAVNSAVTAVRDRIERLLNAPDPQHPPEYFHRKLGQILWDNCGMTRDPVALREALARIPPLREQFWREVKVTGSGETFNQTLERAGRIADFMELGELMCIDALDRNESCGSHARTDHVTDEGEARRDDENYSYVAAWEFSGDTSSPNLHREQLRFEFVHPSVRSYK